MPPKSASPSRPQSGARPKSTGGTGGKKSALGQAPVSAAAAVDELKQKAELLEKSLRNEELARNFIQLERDKIQAFWDITKKDLGDKKAELRVKDKELEEAQDQHALELKVYKQKVKHLLYEHQANVSKLKAEGEVALKQQADTFAQQEALLADDKRRLKQHVREQELSAEEMIKQFRLDNAKQVSRLRQEFELQARQIQHKYEAQLRALQEAAEQHYAADLAEVEERKSAHIADMMARHEAAFKDMRAYYAQVTHANLDLIKALKEEIADMKQAEVQREKLVGDVVRENKRLAEPLTKAVQEADALRQQVEGAYRDRTVLAATKARLAAAEKRVRGTEWELEVTQQRLEQVQRERDELQHKFEEAVLQAQQRSALRAAVLERRLEAASSELAIAQQQQQAGAAAAGSAAHSRAGSAAVVGRLPSASRKPGGSGAGGRSEEQEQGGPGSRRGSTAAAGACGAGQLDWVKAMLEAALHTPLPDQDADILEDDAPQEILEQIAELEAADADVAPPAGDKMQRGVVSRNLSEVSPFAALEAKLSQAALAAQAAVAGGLMAGSITDADGLTIAAHRTSLHS